MNCKLRMCLNEKITLIKLNLFYKYNCDIDDWTRGAKKSEKFEMSDSDWYLIDEFINEVNIILNGLSSKKFMESFVENRMPKIDSIETFDFLLNKIGHTKLEWHQIISNIENAPN